MPDYTALASTSSRLIANAGALLTFSRSTDGPYDPTSGELIQSIATYQSYGVWLEYRTREIDGTLIQIGDAKVLCDPLDTQPKIGDEVTKDGEVWRVINVDPLSPGSTDVLYTLQVRK